MVAWHEDGNTYWVANSLLQEADQRPDGRNGALDVRDQTPQADAEAKEGGAMSGAGKEPIGVIGVGWVGLVTAACFADLGHPVVARDIVPEKVEALSRGEVTIHEPGLDELLREERREVDVHDRDRASCWKGRRHPLRLRRHAADPIGDADLSRVRSVVEELPVGGGHVLVMKSTVPAGTGAAIRRGLEGTPTCPARSS